MGSFASEGGGFFIGRGRGYYRHFVTEACDLRVFLLYFLWNFHFLLSFFSSFKTE